MFNPSFEKNILPEVARVRGYLGYRFPYLSNDDLDDLMQDGLLKAFRLWPTYDPERASVRGWFTMITKHIIISWLKKERAIPVHDLVVVCPQHIDTALHYRMELDRVEAAMRELPDEWRIILVRYVEGEHYDQIADDMNVKLGTVKSRLFRARARLNKARMV